MDEDLYDEFGNYIGPDILSDSQSDKQQNEAQQQSRPNQPAQVIHSSNQHQIILHEDKKYYPLHEQMYPQAEIMIQQEDRQDIDTPIVTKHDNKHFDHHQLLSTTYQINYMLELMKNQALVRNICVAGNLGHGKTLLIDMLIQQTHIRKWDLDKNYRWMDSRFDEQQRQMTIKTKPITLMLPDFKDKNYIFNILDSPGHPNFIGQLVASLRISDGVVLVVDVVEGVMMMDEKVIRHIIRQNLDVIVVINKMDRLIVQLKIPPEDAYLKIRHTLEQINGLFQKISNQIGLQNRYKISPLLNNVIFSSAEYSFMFSIQSMVEKYRLKFPAVQSNTFKKILWGDFYFNMQNKKFTKKPQSGYRKRTFVEFILEPIYKIFAHTIGKDQQDLQPFLSRNLGISLTKQEYRLNVKSMVKLIFHKYFKNSPCLVSSLIQHVRHPKQRVNFLMNKYYRCRDGTYQFKQRVIASKNDGPLLIQTVKMYHKTDYKTFDVLGRVISGTLKKNDQLRILGENYQPGDDQDMFVKNANKLYILQGRYKIQVEQVTAGNLVLIEGIDNAIVKTSTIVHYKQDHRKIDIILPLKFWTEPTIKVSIEPLIPSQLPKMIEAIRKVNKSYVLLKTKVQQSGQHVLIGTGQLHLQCILKDIRLLYSDIQIRISDPCVVLCQTVAQTSGIPCHADTPNNKNRIKALAGPLQKGISDSVEKQLISINNQKQLVNLVEKKYGWDELASNNIWSFGPQETGANVFINDSLVSQADQALLERVRPSLIQGFKWSSKEGPLCDQPMRNVKFRIIDAQISSNPLQCPPGQLIPTTRRALNSAFLTANPRIMQPVFMTQIQCASSDCIDAVFNVLAKRRGTVRLQTPKPGTPLHIIKATLPCIEAIGFQTDLRSHTIGQAFCLSTFDHWQILPGDPLDKNIVLKPLQIMKTHQLARQFMIKTRRRKGLNQQVSIVKYFDDLNVKQILKNDTAFKDFV